MTIGARGENVKILQRALIAAGITVRGGADGVFGAMTAAALTGYQQAKGLPATGVLDDAVDRRPRPLPRTGAGTSARPGAGTGTLEWCRPLRRHDGRRDR